MTDTAQTIRFRRNIRWIYAIALLLGGGYAAVVLTTGFSLSCPLYQLHGIQCPGCGLSRMFLSLLRGDFIAAFRYNPVMFCLFFLWNIQALLCYGGWWKLFRSPRWMYTLLGLSVTALLVFFVWRNWSLFATLR